MKEVASLDGMAQAELCARGEVSAAELLDACLERIDALNPLLRAVVTVEREPPRPAKSGPFSGVPFLMKDSTSWPGLRLRRTARINGYAPIQNIAGCPAMSVPLYFPDEAADSLSRVWDSLASKREDQG